VLFYPSFEQTKTQNPMRTFLFSLCAALLSTGLTAQNFNGKAVYHSAVSLDISLDSTSANQDQQDQMQKMLREAMQKDQELLFDKYSSVYREQESLEKEGAGVGFKMFASIMGSGGTHYKNTKTMESLRASEFFGKQFLIEDTLETPEWKLEKDSKQIGKYTCYKATCTKKTLEKSFSSINGKDEISEDTVEITITAWYTPQIPISTGPDVYFGLPGLILEVNDGTTQMLCTKLILNPKEPVVIEKPTTGERVSEKEYEEIVAKKLEQMQKMYGGERQKRGGGGGNIQIKVR
jgi:GLPGLI family protein